MTKRPKASGISGKKRKMSGLKFLVDPEGHVDMQYRFRSKCHSHGMTQQRAFDLMIDQFTRGESHYHLRDACEDALKLLEDIQKRNDDVDPWPEVLKLRSVLKMKNTTEE